MTTCYLAPDPIQSTQFIPGGNTPANGGKLFFYQNLTINKQTVYKDSAAAVSWTNPIILDSGGNLPSGGEVWFPAGQTYTVVFAPSTDSDPPGSPYWTKDNLTGMNDASAFTGLEWITGPTPTFVNASAFRVSGDQTATLTVGRRIQATVTGPPTSAYGTISSVTFATGSTTVGITTTGPVALDAGLSALNYGLLNAVTPSVPAMRTNAFFVADATDPTKTASFSLSSVASSTNVLIPILPAGVAGASLVGLSQKTVANSSLVSFGTSDVSYTAFDEYVFDIYNAMPTAAGSDSLNMFVSNDGGTSWGMPISSFTSFTRWGTVASSTWNTTTRVLASQGITEPLQGQTGVLQPYGLSARIRVTQPGSTTFQKQFFLEKVSHLQAASSNYVYGTGFATMTSVAAQTSAVNAIKFQYGASNISTGIFKVWGLKQ